MLHAEEDPEVLEWIQTKQYMSPRIQNEIIEALGLSVLREISSNIRDAHIYTIMADESAGISNKEQVVIWSLFHTKISSESTLLTEPRQKRLSKPLKTHLKNAS